MLKNFPVSPYGIFEILMEVNRDEKNPRLRLRIGETGDTGSYAALNISTHPIDGLVGRRSVDEAESALSGNGSIAIPTQRMDTWGEVYFYTKSWIAISEMSG